MDDAGLLVSSGLHLLAAGAWLGGLPALGSLVSCAPIPAAVVAARRFSPLGTACVLVLAGSASVQGWTLIGGLPELLNTAYGRMALVKLMLFLGLLGLAAVNRFRLTLALDGTSPEAARRRLVRSIGLETCVGLLVVLAAAVLTSLPPAMHLHPLSAM